MAVTLTDRLSDWEGTQAGSASMVDRKLIVQTIEKLAEASIGIGTLLAREALTLGRAVGKTPEGDTQKAIDVQAEEVLLSALANSPVGVVGSEEQDDPIVLDTSRPLVVVTDPLDGSDNVDINAPVGLIFSIYRTLESPLESLLQPGSNQLAAGVVIYGPMTLMLLTVGQGTDLYALSPVDQVYSLAEEQMQIPEHSSTFSINSSNYRYWSLGYQAYYKDLLAGADSERGRNFNTRWLGALVGEALRIFRRGGVYIYPGDSRDGYTHGRLRLVYEANPIAMLVKEAGGRTTDGINDILSMNPRGLHQRVPLIFGSTHEVDIVGSYDGLPTGSRSPLFADRSLFLSA